jgi:hypothetical protein
MRFVLARPQESFARLQRVSFLYRFTALAVLGWGIDTAIAQGVHRFGAFSSARAMARDRVVIPPAWHTGQRGSLAISR